MSRKCGSADLPYAGLSRLELTGHGQPSRWHQDPTPGPIIHHHHRHHQHASAAAAASAASWRSLARGSCKSNLSTAPKSRQKPSLKANTFSFSRMTCRVTFLGPGPTKTKPRSRSKRGQASAVGVSDADSTAVRSSFHGFRRFPE